MWFSSSFAFEKKKLKSVVNFISSTCFKDSDNVMFTPNEPLWRGGEISQEDIFLQDAYSNRREAV